MPLLIAGGAFFQVEKDKDLMRYAYWNPVELSSMVFQGNHAHQAGGGFFVDLASSIDCDCKDTGSIPYSPEAAAPFSLGDGYFVSNFDCKDMKGNTVSDGGYGPTAATPTTSFYVTLIFDNGTRQRLGVGSAFDILDWKAGDVLPIVEFSLFDHFYQGPAATKSTSAVADLKSQHQLVRYDVYAKANLVSPDGLIPNPLIADVSTGTGNITVGGPLQIAGNYSLLLWIGDKMTENITINIVLRDCTVNEQLTHGGTFCSECDTEHYNIHPMNDSCKPCPDHCSCSAWGVAPKKKHWIPSPCSTAVKECLSDEACSYSKLTIRHYILTCSQQQLTGRRS